jgi:hypothetical protein
VTCECKSLGIVCSVILMETAFINNYREESCFKKLVKPLRFSVLQFNVSCSHPCCSLPSLVHHLFLFYPVGSREVGWFVRCNSIFRYFDERQHSRSCLCSENSASIFINRRSVITVWLLIRASDAHGDMD